jgi:hypothetical protein
VLEIVVRSSAPVFQQKAIFDVAGAQVVPDFVYWGKKFFNTIR